MARRQAHRGERADGRGSTVHREPSKSQRPVLNPLLRDHWLGLYVFSNDNQTTWHFLNVKYDDSPEKRRLFRRIRVEPGIGLRTAAERIEKLDLAYFGKDLFGKISPLKIQETHDDAFDVEKVTKEFYREIANWYFWASQSKEVAYPPDVKNEGDKALFLIRLLTRLIFCWFLKEKRNPKTGNRLIPDDLFEPRWIKEILKDPLPSSRTFSSPR